MIREMTDAEKVIVHDARRNGSRDKATNAFNAYVTKKPDGGRVITWWDNQSRLWITQRKEANTDYQIGKAEMSPNRFGAEFDHVDAVNGKFD